MRVETWLRAGMAVLALVGCVILIESSRNNDEAGFKGAVMVIPAEADLNLSVTVTFHPAGQKGSSAIPAGWLLVSPSGTTDSSQTGGSDDRTMKWYVMLMGDARLSSPVILDTWTGETKALANGVKNGSFGQMDGVPVTYQMYQVELGSHQSLAGVPQNSPAVESGGLINVTMPTILSNRPEISSGRKTMVIQPEEPLLVLMEANPQLMRPQFATLPGWSGWKKPKTATYIAETGYWESQTLTVVRTLPDVDRGKWNGRVVMESPDPFTATANLQDADQVTSANLRTNIGWALGAFFLTMLGEAIASSRRGRPSNLKDVRSPVRIAPTTANGSSVHEQENANRPSEDLKANQSTMRPSPRKGGNRQVRRRRRRRR